MPVITLTSDYGLTDYRVAAIKGKIFSLKEDLSIVDISHDIQAHNLTQTSYVFSNAYPFFPKGTVHIIAVDSFFTKHRKCLLFKMDGHYFIAADNGVFSLIFPDQKPEAVYEITFNNRFDDVVEFTATDIFVPAAVHLQNGGLPEVIGRKIKSYKQKKLLPAQLLETEKMIAGDILYVDHFGNIVSNITKEMFDKQMLVSSDFTIKIRNIRFNKIHKSYTDVVTDWDREQEFHSTAVAFFNQADYLEIGIYKGSKTNGAQVLFGVTYGEKIFIEFQ